MKAPTVSVMIIPMLVSLMNITPGMENTPTMTIRTSARLVLTPPVRCRPPNTAVAFVAYRQAETIAGIRTGMDSSIEAVGVSCSGRQTFHGRSTSSRWPASPAHFASSAATVAAPR